MREFIKELFVYFVSFAVCLYALHGVDFEKFMKKNQTMKIQTLYLIMAAALAYLLGQFLLSIMYHYI